MPPAKPRNFTDAGVLSGREALPRMEYLEPLGVYFQCPGIACSEHRVFAYTNEKTPPSGMGWTTPMAKNRKNKVFNDRNRKVFRKNISSGEMAFGFFFILFVMLMGAWFVVQKDNFDPGERDISIEVLNAQSVEDKLYRTPLLRWVDPALARTPDSAAPDLGIFPPSLVGGGWETSSRVEVFDGANVYEKINGQEDQYKQFGFQFLHFVAIANPEQELDLNVELYDMGSFVNALGVFAAQRSEDSRVEQFGNTYYYPTEAGVLGILDRYFFKLSGNESSPAIRAKAIEFVKAFAPDTTDTIESGVAPRGLMLLTEGLGVPFRDIAYLRQDVFQYDFAKDFWFGKVTPESKARYFFHEDTSETAAAELFDMILEEQLYEYTLVERNGNRCVLKHEFMKTFMILNQRGPFVYGIDGAPDGDQAATSQEALERVLFAAEQPPSQ